MYISFHWLIVLWLFRNHSMGDGNYPGWNLCFLHLNCWCFSRGNYPIYPGFKQVCGGWHGVRLCHWAWLQAVAFAGAYCSWWLRNFLPLGAFLWDRGFPQISLVANYIQLLEDVAADFTTGIWVLAVYVATV